MGAFRGAGRPEAAAFLERIMDIAADELGIDPVELRRRNLLGADQFPYTHARRARPTTSATTRPPSTRPSRVAGYDDLRRRAGGPAPSAATGCCSASA